MLTALRNLGVVVTVAMMPILGAASAQAQTPSHTVRPRVDTSCPHDGYITIGDRCTTLSNGTLYIHNGGSNQGTYVGVDYAKSGGSTLSLKLGYEHSGTNTWGAWENMSAGNDYWSYFYPATCGAAIGLMYQNSTTQWQTPLASC